MTKKNYIIFLLFSSINSFLIAQCCKTSTFHNYYAVDTFALTNALPSSIQDNRLQLQYYPDSIPPKIWLRERFARATFFSESAVNHFADTTFVANQWVNNIDVKNLRVISIINNTNQRQNYYQSHTGEFLKHGTIVQQAKDGFGNWKDIELLNEKGYSYDIGYIESKTVLNLVVLRPTGDFETEIRFKMLVSAPPNYPQEVFIYSTPFKGKVNKESLQKTD